MKKLFLLLVLAFPLAAHAQVPVFMRTARLTAARSADPAAGWNMQSLGITSYMMVWTTDGTVSAGACLFQSSVNNSFASPSTVIAAQTVTSPGNYTTPTSGSINYGRVSCSTPISGSGAVAVTIIGFGPEAGGGTVGIECDGDPCATEATAQLQLTELEEINAGVNSALPVLVIPVGGTIIRGAITTAMESTTSTEVIAGVASNYLYITWCAVSNADLTVSTDILLQNGSGGTTLAVLPAPAAAAATTGGAGGMYTFPTPIPVPTAANGLFAANVTTSAMTKISCGGWRSTVAYF
jgi:hypothetical protein